LSRGYGDGIVLFKIDEISRDSYRESEVARLRFKPQDGIAVVARGRVEFYDARSQVQLLVEL